MFDFNIAIRNPIHGLTIGSDKKFFWIDKKLTKNKNLEIEVNSWHDYLLGISFCSMTKQDHSGIRFEICFLTMCFAIQVYDGRHWDYINDCWEVHGDTK